MKNISKKQEKNIISLWKYMITVIFLSFQLTCLRHNSAILRLSCLLPEGLSLVNIPPLAHHTAIYRPGESQPERKWVPKVVVIQAYLPQPLLVKSCIRRSPYFSAKPACPEATIPVANTSCLNQKTVHLPSLAQTIKLIIVFYNHCGRTPESIHLKVRRCTATFS